MTAPFAPARADNGILRRTARFVATVILLTAVYLAVSLPFKFALELIPGFTDIRPVACLQPIFGVFFGIPGCLAFGVGNLITDAMSDSLRWSSIAGFVANVGNPLLFCLLWWRLRNGVFDLRTGRNIALLAGLSFTCACLQSLVISVAVAAAYPDVDVLLFALSVVGNHTVFPVLFGAPIAILMQEEMGKDPRGLGGRFRLANTPA